MHSLLDSKILAKVVGDCENKETLLNEEICSEVIDLQKFLLPIYLGFIPK